MAVDPRLAAYMEQLRNSRLRASAIDSVPRQATPVQAPEAARINGQSYGSAFGSALTQSHPVAATAVALARNAMIRSSGGDLPPGAVSEAAVRQPTKYSPAFARGAQPPPNQADALLDNIRTLFPGKTKMSMRQLGAVSSALGPPATAKAPTTKDIITQEAANAMDAMFQTDVDAIRSSPDLDDVTRKEAMASRAREYMMMRAALAGMDVDSFMMPGG